MLSRLITLSFCRVAASSSYIIIDGTESTKYPERYSEGVFAWCEDGKLKTSEEYQVENGGDPIVLKKYLLKANTKLIN